MLAFAVAASAERKDVLDATKRLAERLHIANVKYAWLDNRLENVQHRLEAGPHAVALWEVNKSSQYGAEPQLEGQVGGTLLLSVITVEGQGTFVGTAFVTKPGGDHHAATVMESVGTFRVEGAENGEHEAKGGPDP